jgi:endoglucanase
MVQIPLLKKICETPGAPGFEYAIRNVVIEEIRDLVDEFRIDAMGNLICLKKGQESKKIAVTAHMDEISFIVSHIDKDGFIRFQPLGGFDPKTLTAQRVIIHGKKDIIGVMGSKPIHIMSPEERKKSPEIKDFFIDTGLPGEEVQELISIGDPITRERELIEMGQCVNSKSLDNRVSVYILIELLKELKGKTIPYDLYAIFTVQEEVGLRGAQTASYSVAADFGINVDVTIAFDVPGAQPQEVVSKLGGGTAIKVLDGTSICDHRMVKFLKQTASKHNIKYQMEILAMGGTDTAFLQRAGHGSIAGAISIPTRHIHQVIEMAHKEDIRLSIDLLREAVLGISEYDWAH